MASFYFMKAHKAGMTEDSLKYFLAEVALQKGALEEAFIINMQAQQSQDSSVRAAAARQFLILQSFISTNGHASEKNFNLQNSIFPKSVFIDLISSAGYTKNENINGDAIIRVSNNSQRITYSQGGADYSLLFTSFAQWRASWFDLTLGLITNMSRPYYSNFEAISLEPLILLDGLIPYTEISYEFSRERENDIIGTSFKDLLKLKTSVPDSLEYIQPNRHTITLEFKYTASKFKLGTELQSKFEMTDDYGYKRWSIKCYWKVRVKRLRLYTYLKSSLYYINNPYLGDTYSLVFADNLDATTPVRYTNINFKDTLSRFDYGTSGENHTGQYANNYHQLKLYMSGSKSLISRISMNASVAFLLERYSDENIWINGPDSLTYILNKKDKKLYELESHIANNQVQYGKAHEYGQVHRLDKIVEASVGLLSNFGKWGSLYASVNTNRYWTNIDEMSTDYRIPLWEYYLYFSYTLPLYQRY